jgi:hypothetical protein
MVILIRLIALICAVLSGAHPAHAERKVEEFVFEDCDAAKDRFSQLAPDEQRSLFEFLTRVITLNTQAPSAPEAFAQLPGKPLAGESILPGAGIGGDIVPGSLWQTMDAKRELLGKRCALRIFALAGASALPVLPKLASIYSRENLSDEIAVSLEETSASIAEQAHRAGTSPSDAHIEEVTALLTSDKPLVARNFLHEYVGLTLPHVTKHLSLVDGSDGAKIVEFLKEVDPDGSRGMRAFLDLLVSLPEEQQQRLGRQLPLPARNVLPSFVPDFVRLASDPAKSQIFMPLLAKSCVILDGITADAALVPALIQRSSFDSLDLAEQRCLLRSVPALAKRLPAMLASQNRAQQLQAIELVSASAKLLNGELRGVLWGKVRDLASSDDQELQRAALKALVSAPDRRGDAASAIVQALKSPPLIEGSTVSPSQQQAVDALAELGYSKESSKAVPYALLALRASLNTAGAESFLSRADDAETELIKLLQQTNRSVQGRALASLAGRKSLSQRAATAALALLGDPELGRLAEVVIAKAPAAATVPMMRRTLPRSEGEARTSLLSLLQELGAATKGESAELAAQLVKPGCAQLSRRGAAIEKLLKRKDVDASIQALLRDRCDECVGQLPENVSSEILDSRLKGSTMPTNAVTAILSQKGVSDEVEERLLEDALASSLSASEISSVAVAVLSKGSRPAVLALLASPKLKDATSGEVTKALHNVVSDAKNDEELRLAAIRALLSLNDSTYDWKDFVKESITAMAHDGDHRAVREVIRLLPPQVVLEEVASALNSDSQDKVVGACRVGAALGPQAVPIVSKVWNLRESRSPAIKYAAVLALLEINPLTPDLQDHLKRLLVNRYYPSALQPPIPWRNTVAVVDLNAASFGTLRTVRLEQLLGHL